MSKGKYSPAMTREQINRPDSDYIYNADGQIPPEWTLELEAKGVEYDQRLHFANYDKDGYDTYGYSAFDANGNYVGEQRGVDRWGYTEDEYLCMSEDDFESICIHGG